jgi:hypothetical protein
MKIHNIPLAAVTVIASLAAAQMSVAQTNTNLFRADIHVTCVFTNASGNLVYERNNTSDFIQDCASDHGITNLTGLSLVFNRSNSTLQVVSGTNQTLVCTPLSFTNGLSLTNTNHTVIELQKFVLVESNTVVSGVLTATEHLTYGTSNQLTSFTLIGRLSYTEPASGTNPPAICRGILLVGHEDEDDDDDNGNNGNNGHHGNGNNGHHGEGNNGNGLGNGGPNGNNPGKGHNH